MKKITVLILFVLVLAMIASPVGAIIGGEIDFEHTNVGAIMMEWPQFDNIVGRLCSGTLIHERALLTAAHCHKYIVEQGISMDQVWVTFDQNPFDEDATYLDVESVVPHPDLDMWALDTHDIALVILKEPVPKRLKTEPEPLPDLEYMDEVMGQANWQDLNMTVVGYGVSDLDVDYPPAIQLDAERHSGLEAIKDLAQYEINTVQTKKPESVLAYLGDSGGPLFHRVSADNEVLVGLVSCIDPFCIALTAVYYRLDTESAQDWINSELDKLDQQ